MKKVLRNLLLVCLCFLLTGCFGSKKENKKVEKTNKTVIKSKDVIKEQIVDGIKISDVKLSVSDGISTYTAKVTNTKDKDVSIEDINIVFKDKKDKEMVSMLGYVGGTIKPNDSKEIISSTDMDLTKASSVSYKINKK